MSKHEFAHGGKEHAVVLRDAGDGRVQATITAGKTSEALSLEATDLGGGRWLVRQGDDVHDARVERGPDGSVRVVFATGAVALEALDPFRDSVRKGKGGGGGRRTVNAPIPGRVLDVLVAEGDTVTAGQPVVVVEAMKMANELRAPIAGRIVKITATKGSPVDAGATLAVIEG